jgi:hypothetical protein
MNKLFVLLLGSAFVLSAVVTTAEVLYLPATAEQQEASPAQVIKAVGGACPVIGSFLANLPVRSGVY